MIGNNIMLEVLLQKVYSNKHLFINQEPSFELGITKLFNSEPKTGHKINDLLDLDNEDFDFLIDNYYKTSYSPNKKPDLLIGKIKYLSAFGRRPPEREIEVGNRHYFPYGGLNIKNLNKLYRLIKKRNMDYRYNEEYVREEHIIKQLKFTGIGNLLGLTPELFKEVEIVRLSNSSIDFIETGYKLFNLTDREYRFLFSPEWKWQPIVKQLPSARKRVGFMIRHNRIPYDWFDNYSWYKGEQ